MLQFLLKEDVERIKAPYHGITLAGTKVNYIS
jgi:hypothetical protein